MAFSVLFLSTFFLFFFQSHSLLSIFNKFMQGAYTFSLSLFSLLSVRSSLYRLAVCVCSLRCRSVKLWGCESLQHGSSVLLCTQGDAGMTTVPIGNAIATTLTKQGKNRCAEFLHCRVSLSYSLSQHFLHYSCGNLHNHLETLFKRDSLLFAKLLDKSQKNNTQPAETQILVTFILLLTKNDHSWKKMVNVNWKSWGNPYAQICSAVIPMLRYEDRVSIYSTVLLFPLYSPLQHHFPWKHVDVLF